MSSIDLERLRQVISDLESVVVTFSGGVDSALVSKLAHDVLGDRALSITATSDTLPDSEVMDVRTFVSKWKVGHRFVASNELENEAYQANTGDRCYHCKSELFSIAEQVRQELGFAWVVDGTIVEDLGAHRPGLVAAAEKHVRHPLVDAGFSKVMVRDVSKSMGMDVWDKPSFACLGSRFPVGTRVTSEKILRVAALERAVREQGCRQFRVRWHELDGGVLARIEVSPDEIVHVAKPEVRAVLVEVAKEAGFRWVTLDMLGYGSPG
jgi:uncharacterized protein